MIDFGLSLNHCRHLLRKLVLGRALKLVRSKLVALLYRARIIAKLIRKKRLVVTAHLLVRALLLKIAGTVCDLRLMLFENFYGLA